MSGLQQGSAKSISWGAVEARGVLHLVLSGAMLARLNPMARERGDNICLKWRLNNLLGVPHFMRDSELRGRRLAPNTVVLDGTFFANEFE